MLVLDALFDHIQQISSHVEIIGSSLIQRSPMSASDVRVGCKAQNPTFGQRAASPSQATQPIGKCASAPVTGDAADTEQTITSGDQ